MTLYVIVKTARKDVSTFPGYFPEPYKPAICLIDSCSGDSCTSDKGKAEETANGQIAEYGDYFNYTVYELEIEL